MKSWKQRVALVAAAGTLMLNACAAEGVVDETEESAISSKSGTLDAAFGKGGRVVRGDALPRSQDRVSVGERLVFVQDGSIRLYDPSIGFMPAFGEKGGIALSGLLASNEEAILRPRTGSGFYLIAARKDGTALRVLAFGSSGVRDGAWGSNGELVVSGVADGVLDGKGRLVLFGKSSPVRIGTNGKIDPTFVATDARLRTIETLIAEKRGIVFAKLLSGELLRLREDGGVDAAFQSKGEKLVSIAERIVGDEQGGVYLQGVDYLAHLKATGAVDTAFANEIGNYSKVGERLDLTYDPVSKGLFFAFEYVAPSVGVFSKVGTLGVMKVDGVTGKRLPSFDKDGVTQFPFDQLEIDAASLRIDAAGKLWVHANLFSDQSLSFGTARLWK